MSSQKSRVSLLVFFLPYLLLFAQDWSLEQLKELQKNKDIFRKDLDTTPSPPVATPQGQGKGTLRVHFPFEPAHLNPLTSNDVYLPYFQSLLGEPLLRKENGRYLPALCTTVLVEDLVILESAGSTEYLADKVFGKTTKTSQGIHLKPLSKANPSGYSRTIPEKQVLKIYRNAVFTFSLRNDIQWHDGTPFQAEDIEFSFHKLKDKAVSAEFLRSAYEKLHYCAIPQGNLIRFIFEEDNIFALDLLAQFPLLPRHLYENAQLSVDEQNKILNRAGSLNQHFIGLGPYRIQEWIRGKTLTLEVFPQYYDKQRAGSLQNLLFHFIPETSLALEAFERGELDFLPFLTPKDHYERFLQDPQVLRGSWICNTFSGIGWNSAHPAFRDRRVRIALASLFDREAFIEKHLYGEAQPLTLPWKSFTPEPALMSPEYNPSKAQELLESAGWKDRNGDGLRDFQGKTFSFEILYPQGDPLAPQVLQTFANTLATHQIHLIPRPLPWAYFQLRLRKQLFDGFYFTQAPALDPLIPWSSRQTTTSTHLENGLNYGGFYHEKWETPLQEIRQTWEASLRQVHIQKFEALLVEEQPYLFLWLAPSFFLYRSPFYGVHFSETFPGWNLSQWFISETH
jgi:peptide/nickel transport system substrate-binding protein